MAALEPVLANVLSQYIATVSRDVTGVFTQSFTQVFRAARSIKVAVVPKQELMKQPLETGATTVDHKVIQPLEIEMSMIIPNGEARDVLQEITQLWSDGELLIVQNKSGVYQNMVIEALPNEETPDMFNAISVALKLVQVTYANTTTKIVPVNPVNNSTVDRGTQQTNDASEKKNSAAFDLLQKFSA
jgi:hypothetical protein